MRIAILAVACGLLAAVQASAQSYGLPPGPKLGEIEVKAYQAIPKTKIAVQLTSDTHLSRELRRQVMVRLSKRGNEVGFSGGNVMRMDVSYFDFTDSGRGDYGTQGGQPSYAAPGSNPRMDLPSNTIRRRDGLGAPTSVPTLRITLTLYADGRRQGAVGGDAARAPPRPTRRRTPARRSSTASSTAPTRAASATPAARFSAPYNRRKSSHAASGSARPEQAHARTEEGGRRHRRRAARRPARAVRSVAAASPHLADRAQKLGEYCRFNNSLPKDLSELAICLVGRHFKAQYEFYAHARLAKEAGLSPAIVEAVRTRQSPPFTRDVEKIVYDFVTEYLETNRVSAPNYKRAVDAFGEQGVVDLVGVCGYYMLVSMTLNVFEMPLPPGEPDPLA